MSKVQTTLPAHRSPDSQFFLLHRNSKFKPVFAKLKDDLARVNMYVREANDLALELSVDARYSVTLQIPASNLSPNRRVSSWLYSAILVKFI